jgi:para-nitrobenzyl esterase
MKLTGILFPGFITTASILFLCMSYGRAQPDIRQLNPQVHIPQGWIRGYMNDGGSVAVFKGIPYAASPVGNLRWKAPQSPERWEGIRDASQFCASCIQEKVSSKLPWTEEFLVQDSVSEDCLYLNIWAPANPINRNRPVMVYIHGGAFIEGSGSVRVYDGEELARKGILVVTVNYRLGVLGFLAHPELSAESPHGVSGNYGLLDQIAALKWVKMNIARFGGDSANVTLAGQSAGARSVHLLTASPLARGLFHKAIAISGSDINRIRFSNSLKDAEKSGEKFSCEKRAFSLKNLRAMHPSELIASAPGGMPYRFSANIDGWLLPGSIASVFEKGLQNDVPTLTGLTADESSASPGYGACTPEDLEKQAQRIYGERTPEFLSLYLTGVSNSGKADKEWQRDRGRMSMYKWAEFRSQSAKTAVYTYYFQRGIPWPEHPHFGAFHTGDIPYFFNNLKMINRPWTAGDYKLADHASSYLVNFVATGNPNGKGLPEWPAFKPEDNSTFQLGLSIQVIQTASLEKFLFYYKFYH